MCDDRVSGLVRTREPGPVRRSRGAVGDSRSALSLWASVGLSAAFDASAGAHEEATVTVDDDGLRGVAPALSRLVAATLDGRHADGRLAANRAPLCVRSGRRRTASAQALMRSGRDAPTTGAMPAGWRRSHQSRMLSGVVPLRTPVPAMGGPGTKPPTAARGRTTRKPGRTGRCRGTPVRSPGVAPATRRVRGRHPPPRDPPRGFRPAPVARSTPPSLRGVPSDRHGPERDPGVGARQRGRPRPPAAGPPWRGLAGAVRGVVNAGSRTVRWAVAAQARVHFWPAWPLQVHRTSGVPSAVPAPSASRHRPAWTLRIDPS